jgi:OmpA-OmpF porin, OOP family
MLPIGVHFSKSLLVMRKYSLLLLLLVSGAAIAQNLIPNGDFERYQKCPKALGQLDRCESWSSPNQGTPDFFSTCYTKDAETVGVPNNFFGTRAAFDGHAYAGILYGAQEREYLQIRLMEPLVKGRRYCLRFRAAAPSPKSDGRAAIKVAFVESIVANETWDAVDIPADELLGAEWNVGKESADWAMFATNYVATGGEIALVVGYFQPLEFRAYTFLDCFEMYESASPYGCVQTVYSDEDEDQANLVPNPGFERKFECPKKREDLAMAVGWQVEKNTPDFYHVCGTGSAAVPQNELGIQNPHSGSGYGGIWTMFVQRGDYREFVKTRLRKPLEAGKKYCLSIWVSLAEDSDHALDELQLRITPPGENSICQVGIDTSELVTLRNGRLLDNYDDWVFLHGTFVAKGGEQIIMIGNFRGNEDPHMQPLKNISLKLPQFRSCSYYYIDDLGLHEVGGPTCSCPSDPIVFTQEDPKLSEPLPQQPVFQVGDTLVLRNLHFAFDKADLLPLSFPQLDSLADYLRSHPELKIRITGHTDSDGEARYNLNLSQARAASVLNYLTAQRIARSRMQSAGKGEEQPSNPNDDDARKALNRRVEVEFLGE